GRRGEKYAESETTKKCCGLSFFFPRCDVMLCKKTEPNMPHMFGALKKIDTGTKKKMNVIFFMLQQPLADYMNILVLYTRQQY
ncbi:hypothetical protein ACJX0J_038439, partial [Zea mays]